MEKNVGSSSLCVAGVYILQNTMVVRGWKLGKKIKSQGGRKKRLHQNRVICLGTYLIFFEHKFLASFASDTDPFFFPFFRSTRSF